MSDYLIAQRIAIMILGRNEIQCIIPVIRFKMVDLAYTLYPLTVYINSKS